MALKVTTNFSQLFRRKKRVCGTNEIKERMDLFQQIPGNKYT